MGIGKTDKIMLFCFGKNGQNVYRERLAGHRNLGMPTQARPHRPHDARGGTAAERQPPLALQASQPHSLRHRRGRPASYGRRIKSTIAKNFLPSTMCPPEASLICA